MRQTVACGLALVLTFATGCAPTVEVGARGTKPSDTAYPAAQSWALDDGVVSESEYRSAIEGFVLCMRDAGYSVSDPMLSPIDGLTLLYDVTPSGSPDAWNKKVEDCNLAHVSHIEPTYVEAREQIMDPLLQIATVKCLRDKGFSLEGAKRNVKEFVDATDGIGNVVMECVTTSMQKLFPQVPGFLKVRW